MKQIYLVELIRNRKTNPDLKPSKEFYQAENMTDVWEHFTPSMKAGELEVYGINVVCPVTKEL